MFFYFWKMISAETPYMTYNVEILAIIKVLKTWHHYLKIFKYEVIIHTDHNKLHNFISIKNQRS